VAIKTKVMRGKSVPSALLIAPELFSRAREFKRWPFDLDAAKKLMADGGYPNGFDVSIDCPNDPEGERRPAASAGSAATLDLSARRQARR
jgi:ABC-type transport system substrate-binding protein